MNAKFEPILMIDNEYENISDLEEILERAAQKAFPDEGECIQYAESPEEATEFMKERMQQGRRYSALICDNHYYAGIDGDDFIRLLHGQLGYCHSKDERHLYLKLSKFRDLAQITRCTGRENKEVTLFLKENFANLGEYKCFVEYYFGNPEECPKVILYCGNVSEADTSGFYGVAVVQKGRSGLDDENCERNLCLSEEAVLQILEEEDIFTPEQIAPVVMEHPRISPQLPEKDRVYDSYSHHIKRRKKIVVKRAHYKIGEIFRKKVQRNKKKKD